MKFKTWDDQKRSILSGYRRKLKKNPTQGERNLVALFMEFDIGAIFQKGWLINGSTFYISDFYLPFCKTVIEVDGQSHINGKQKTIDLKKDKYYAMRGLKILRLNIGQSRGKEN